MGFERFHPEPIVQRNLIRARELRAAYLHDLLVWLKTSTTGWARSLARTEREAVDAIGNKPRAAHTSIASTK